MAVAAVTALTAAGCGGGGSDTTTAASTGASTASSGGSSNCAASIAVLTPLSGPPAQQGLEQLHFAQLAASQYNQKNGTDFTILQGDTQLDPAQATTVAQQMISNDKVLGIVGPAGSDGASAVGPLLKRSNLVAVTPSATGADLTTSGKNPTFLRVVPPDSVQGPTDADYMVNQLHAKKVFIVDDQTSYSTGIADSAEAKLKSSGVTVDRESINQKETDFSSLVAKISADTDVVFLPWQLAASAQQLGAQMQEQGKKAVIFGSDGLFSIDDFHIDGSYVSSFAPDITSIPADKSIVKAFKAKYGKFGTFGPPAYAAATVVMDAIKRVCDSGSKPSREAVLNEVKKTDEPDSILGQPIKFTPQGDLENAKFFIFQISKGGYVQKAQS
jgi:branched-chain amino acid transport system substrate-binding protein